MKLLTTSVLSLGLFAALTASAQNNAPVYPAQGNYGGVEPGAAYDYAKVIRVDPVIDDNRTASAGSSSSSQKCYSRQAEDAYRGNNDPYVNNDGYANGSYPQNDRYSNPYPNGNANSTAGSETGRTIATVLGGIAGAVLGSKMGGGSGRYVTSSIGSMMGGMAGRSVYDKVQQSKQPERYGTVTVCDPVPVREGNVAGSTIRNESVSGYDVTYEYAGRTYHTRTNYHPGDKIRVRVDVRAE